MGWISDPGAGNGWTSHGQSATKTWSYAQGYISVWSRRGEGNVLYMQIRLSIYGYGSKGGSSGYIPAEVAVNGDKSPMASAGRGYYAATSGWRNYDHWYQLNVDAGVNVAVQLYYNSVQATVNFSAPALLAIPVYVNVEGTVHQVQEAYINVDGTIKKCEVYLNVDGVVKKIG